MDPVLEERRARHAERHAAAARKATALERIAELEPQIGELGADQLDELEQLAAIGHGEYTAAAFALRGLVRARRQALADAAASTPDPDDAGADSTSDDQAATEPADVELDLEDRDVDVDEAAAVADDRNGEQQDA